MILILGASSYVGRNMFAAFGSSTAIGTHNSNPVPDSIFFDVNRMQLSDILPRNPDISHAVILYAVPQLDACKADPVHSYQINVSSAKRIIDDLATWSIKPIFTSSEYVFDGEKGNYTEDDVPNPSTVYGTQKLEIEQYLAEQGQDYAVLRLAKVFGTSPEDGTILSGWLKQIRNDEELRCARDQVFSPIHVDDVIAATGAVIRQNLSGVYQIANPQAWSRVNMLRALLDSLGTEGRVVECSIRDFEFLDHRPLDLSMSPAKVLKATGLQFKTVQSSCEVIKSRL